MRQAFQPIAVMTLPPYYLVEITFRNLVLTKLVLQVNGSNPSLTVGYKVVVISITASAASVNYASAGIYQEEIIGIQSNIFINFSICLIIEYIQLIQVACILIHIADTEDITHILILIIIGQRYLPYSLVSSGGVLSYAIEELIYVIQCAVCIDLLIFRIIGISHISFNNLVSLVRSSG